MSTENMEDWLKYISWREERINSELQHLRMQIISWITITVIIVIAGILMVKFN